MPEKVPELQMFMGDAYTEKDIRLFRNLCAMDDEKQGRLECIYAAYIQGKREKILRQRGYTWDVTGSIWELLRKKQPYNLMNTCCPPCDDHGTLFFRNGEPHHYLSMPYGSNPSAIGAFANTWNLQVHERPGYSIWFPGSTSGIQYVREEDVDRFMKDGSWR